MNEWKWITLAKYAANCCEKNNTHLRWETYLYSHGISLESFCNVIIQTALSSFKGHGAVKLAGHNGTCQSLFTMLPKEQCHLLALIEHSPHKQVVEVKGDGQRDLSKAAVCWDLSTACGWRALILQDGEKCGNVKAGIGRCKVCLSNSKLQKTVCTCSLIHAVYSYSPPTLGLWGWAILKKCWSWRLLPLIEFCMRPCRRLEKDMAPSRPSRLVSCL